MKRKFTFLIAAAFMLLTMMATTGEMWGQEKAYSLVYTLDGTSTGGSSGYDSESDITQNNIAWKVMGNTTMNPWRIGGKSLTSVNRTIYSQTAINGNITKIEIEHGTASNITVNSMTVSIHNTAANAAAGTNAIATFTPSFTASGTVTVTKSDATSWDGKFYRIVYNVTVSGSSNKFIQFISAKLYKTTYTLTYSANAGGSITSVTNGETPVSSGAALDPGTTLNIVAEANSGYVFNNWTVTGEGSFVGNASEASTTLTLGSANATLTANFVVAGGNYINVSPTTKNVTSAGEIADFTVNTNQTLAANPVQFYTTSTGDVTASKPAWIGDIDYDDGDLLIEVNENTGTVRTAYFRVEKDEVKSDVVTINQAAFSVATPEFDPISGTVFSGEDLVELSCETANSTIYYTMGTNPSNPTNASTEYDPNEGITVTENTTIKAIAYVGEVASEVATATYYVIVHAGTQADPYTVADAHTAIDANTGLTNKYAIGIVSEIVTEYSSQYHNISYNISTDGQTTSDQLQAYRGKSYGGDNFTSANDIQVGDRVIVYGTLKKYGETYEFEQDNQLVTLVRQPIFTPGAGAVAEGTTIAITSGSTTGAKIYYTMGNNPADPTPSSTEYSAPIEINEATTIKAIAVKDGMTSIISSAAYTILEPVATPTFLPEAGTYTWAQSVTISTTTDGATIYYTTNGDYPTTGSTQYTGAIEVNETMTIKAIAAKAGLANSAVAEATYTMAIPVINASNVNLAYNATSGSIAYTMTNPVDGGVLTAAITAGNEGSWLTLGAVSGEAVALTCSANDGNADRNATVTLTYTYNTNKTVTKVITVTQTHFVVDYATLPFEWAGGTSSALTALTGVTANGLGSDYGENNAPYRVKFDTDDDYIQVKTDSQPAKVTIGVKMIGGGNTSYITVKASTDGETFDTGEALTISGDQNDILSLQTTRSFGADVRYVKMVFTKGSNIGVGPITITKYSTDPVINAGNVNIACDATNGSIAYTISNPVEGGALTAAITAGNEGSWLTLGAVTTSVPFTCSANTDEENRTATVRLTYTYNTSETVTKDVTVTQNRRDFAILPFAYNGNGSGILPCGLTQEGVGTYNTAPKMKFDNTDDYLLLKLNEAPVSIIYDIKGNSFSGGTFKVQVSEDGIDYDDLEVYDALGDVQTDTIINNNDDVRYIKWIYTDKSTGNVALGNIQVYDVEFIIINNSTTINNLTIADDETYVVNTDVVLELTGTVTNTNPENLIVAEGGQLIHNAEVNATIQKNVTAASSWKDDVDGWHFIASPVNTTIAESFTSYPIDLFKYDEETAYWLAYWDTPGFYTLERGVGYLHASQYAQTVDFAGLMGATNEAIEKNLDYHPEATHDLTGFNLMGNPFTRNLITGDMKINTTAVTSYYGISDDTKSITARLIASKPIKPGEGFMVQVNEENKIDGQNKLYFNPAPAAKNEPEDNGYISIVAGNENGMDNAFIQIGNGNTLRKMSISNSTKVYVMNGDEDYAAARLDEASGVVPVHFEAEAEGFYTITIEATNLDLERFILIDNFTGEEIDLLVEPSYTFNANSDEPADRFTLLYQVATNEINNINSENEVFAYQSGDELYINGNGTLQVFDVMGRFVMSREINGNEHIGTSTLNTGVYVLRLVGENVKTQKVVIR